MPKKNPAAKRDRGKGGGRIVKTTTISRRSDEFFQAHPLYTIGRAVDDWVDQQAGKEEAQKSDRLTKLLAALDPGLCKCGRIMLPRDGREECVACRMPSASCTCQDSLSLRRHKLEVWMASRDEAGLPTLPADIEAKRAELDLIPRDTFSEMVQRNREGRAPRG